MAKSRALINILNLVESENLPVEQQFLNDLQASIERVDAETKRQPSKSYKPSSLHCIRNMYYQRVGVPVEADRMGSELIGICESGTDRHERLQNAIMQMKNTGVDCEYVDVADYVNTHNLDEISIVSKQGNETKLYHNGYYVSFLCDGIIRYKNHYYILEIKTETANKFWDRKGVNPDHILQGTAYSLLLDIPEVLFLYECRDTCNKKAFILNVTEEMRRELGGKLVECERYAERNVVPAKPDDISPKACGYCSYSERCKLDG